MTLDEFLGKLRETSGPWELDELGGIRSGGCCPITAVDPRHLYAGFVREAADALGLCGDVRSAIVHAADGIGSRCDHALRARLLDATVNRTSLSEGRPLTEQEKR